MSSEQVSNIMTRLAGAEFSAAAAELAQLVKDVGGSVFDDLNVREQLSALMTSKKNADAREGALAAVSALAMSDASRVSEPFLIAILPLVLEAAADKAPNVREAALRTGKDVVSSLCPYATCVVLPVLFDGISYDKKWQTKSASLALINVLVNTAPLQLAQQLPQIVPLVSELMWETKNEVKVAAKQTMTEVCSLVANKDIEQFIPAVIECIADPTKVPATIHLLGATTFVQAVESPTLAIMVPLLARGLLERSTPILRKTALIVDNMCKLVDDPDFVRPFLPKMLPGLRKIAVEVSDPEACTVIAKAEATLLRVAGAVNGVVPETASRVVDPVKTKAALESLVGGMPAVVTAVLDHVSKMCAQLALVKNFDKAAWTEAVVPYLFAYIAKDDAEKVAVAFLDKCFEAATVKEKAADEEDEGEDLCNCEFSLAYGAKVLLNRTRLHLKRGKRYGLCGANGTGKSTLMKAIANEQVEGFPPKSELRTVYVEHDIDGSEADTPCAEFVLQDPLLEGMSKEEVTAALKAVGFSDEMVAAPVGSLSGGWKMKLALARAMLEKADILLLDEPTNHLDVVNVAWLENYLLGLKNVTSLIVSHDSGFLDRVVTTIIHYEHLKLVPYKGNLSAFVSRVPTARAYYELGASEQKFRFPEPGFLEGVKTKERAILKMKDVDFSYPGSGKQQLTGITFQCSLSSRVAVIGPNGAGKSTMIKLLTGELEPSAGVVWKHPNLRIAYVAQHAFHHIEQHLDKTPNQYIQWRYASGEDREELEKVTRQETEEDRAAAKKVHVIDGAKKVVDQVLRRRKLKQSYEYEVSWKDHLSADNTWLPRKTLEEMGLHKMIAEVDAAEAAAQGLNRPLTQKEIEKHLVDVGLDPEFATHAHIRGLSGGQKVRL
ncbi:MAG: P-loop containing nucleoside triphosphate hydrolase protein, partial [Olpidium bornovanus]